MSWDDDLFRSIGENPLSFVAVIVLGTLVLEIIFVLYLVAQALL